MTKDEMISKVAARMRRLSKRKDEKHLYGFLAGVGFALRLTGYLADDDFDFGDEVLDTFRWGKEGV